MKTMNRIILLRTLILCNILCVVGIINGLSLFYTFNPKSDDLISIFLFIGGILSGLGGIVGGIASVCEGMGVADYDSSRQIRCNRFLSWWVCHVYRMHDYKRMRSMYDDFGYEYTDEVCIFCHKTNLDATRHERKEKKKLNIDQLTQKAKDVYLNKLTKEERKELFVERI